MTASSHPEIENAHEGLWARLSRMLRFNGVVGYVVLALLAALFALPLIIVVGTSLKTPEEVFTYPPQLLPQAPTFENYVAAVQEFDIGRQFTNSTIVAVARVAGVLLFNSLVAYAFARLRWPGRELWFWLLLATMVLPDEVTLVPLFILFRDVDLLGTFWPLILPRWVGSPFLIFLMRQFFQRIPEELSEAARIDGANEFQIYARIIMPLSLPVLATVALYEFMWAWNDFTGPLIYLNKPELWTLPIGLSRMANEATVNWGAVMSAALIAMAPVLAVFLTLQRYFIENSFGSGMKG